MIHRISTRAAFRSLSRSRQRASSDLFTVVHSAGPPDPPDSGIGLACATPRSLGSAVLRNRARRRIRAVAREWAREHPSERGWYLVVAGGKAATAEYGDVRDDLRTLLATLQWTARGTS
ncbi:MAG: ribonuclease P protein component [Actinomycetota bacterium]